MITYHLRPLLVAIEHFLRWSGTVILVFAKTVTECVQVRKIDDRMFTVGFLHIGETDSRPLLFRKSAFLCQLAVKTRSSGRVVRGPRALIN